jgi:hypothetical protein
MPMADADYHLLQYTDISEAAAFVAALSRFLTYPPGSKYLSPLAPAEVLSRVLGTGEDIERIEVYLNTAALGAVKEAFGQPPRVERRRGDQLPKDCILLIGAGGVEAWGVEEAQWHILAER